MSAYRLTIDGVPPTEDKQRRMHFRVYGALLKTWFFKIRAAEGFLDIPPPKGKRRLVIIRYGVRLVDQDSLSPTFKPVIDVLRPPRTDEGYYKTGKKKGEYWIRRRIGHGLILEDDDRYLELEVVQHKCEKGTRPRTVLVLIDLPLTPEGRLEK